MSFIRLGKHNYNNGPGGKKFPKTKKIAKYKPKPEWDSTSQDLNVHRATDDEIAYRKAVHASKHVMKGHLINKDANTRPPMHVNHHQAAVLKELLFDHQQLQDVLSRSDAMLGVVKDMFGDDPKKYTGFPNVTTAPGIDKQLLVNELPEVITRMESLSQSVMDGTALNEDTQDCSENLAYEPKIDLQRFQQFLALQEKLHDPSMSTIFKDTASISQSVADGSMFCTPTKEHNESIALLRSPPSAVNDTKKVNRTRNAIYVDQSHTTTQHQTIQHDTTRHGDTTRQDITLKNTTVMNDMTQQNFSSNNSLQKEAQNGRSNLSNMSSFSSDLKKVIFDLDTELSTLTYGPPHTTTQLNIDSFSGYTAVLVNAVTKLTRHVKQTDIQLQAEALVREQLTENVQELRALVDALTSDLITTQDEYAQVLHEFSRYKQSMESQQTHIISCLNDAGLWRPIPSNSEPLTHDTHAIEPDITTLNRDIHIATVDFDTDIATYNGDIDQDTLPHLPSPQVDRIQTVARAVLLSPPIQKSRFTQHAGRTKSANESTVMEQTRQGTHQSTHQSTHHPTHHSTHQPPAVITVPKPTALVQPNCDLPLLHHLSPQHTVNGFYPDVVTMSVSSSEFEEPSNQSNRFVQYNNQSNHQIQLINQSQANSVTAQQLRKINSQDVIDESQKFHLDSTLTGNQQKQYHNLSTNPNYGQDANRLRNDNRFNDQLNRVDLHQERIDLADQISELNRQHEEAERRLESLMLHQKGVPPGCDGIMEVMESQRQNVVSPSISSISQHTITSTNQQPTHLQDEETSKPSLSVSLPRVQWDTSLISVHSQ